MNTPSVFLPFLNEKTLDYRFDNQAFVGFIPPQYSGYKNCHRRKCLFYTKATFIFLQYNFRKFATFQKFITKTTRHY